MTNEQIIAVFKKAVAVLQVIDDGPFRVRAYQTAIETIENLDQELSWLIKQSNLKDLPGIGEELAKKIGDLIETGESDELNRLFMKVPQHMFPLLVIPGVGAKKAYQLATTYPEVDPDKVLKFIKAKAQAGEVAKLPGWGAKSAEKLLINLDKVRGKATRMRLDQADEIANLVIEYLLSIEEVKAASPLGSIRRRRDTIGDLDIGVMASDRNQVLESLKRWDMVERVIAEGENLIRITLQGNKQVDVKFASEKDWGSTLQHFTGSKLHNIKLREYALKRDMSLSEHGIKTKGGLKTFTTEEKFYEYLRLRWVPPELREGQDEINLAKQDKLPRLVTLKDVKGDTHTHTDFKWVSSHDYGAKVEDLLEVSQDLGYEWLCLGDHNPAASKYSLQELVKLIKKRRKWIEDIYSSWKGSENRVNIFISLEVDIKTDGTLALPNEVLAEIDMVIASVHSSFDLNPEAQTKRLLKVINNPYVNIIGHPSGRLIGKREPINVDWEAIMQSCRAHEVALEINANPQRLDLSDSLIREAKKVGVKLSLGSDAHHQSNLKLMHYGIDVARRGGIEKHDIINCLSYQKVRDWLARKRRPLK